VVLIGMMYGLLRDCRPDHPAALALPLFLLLALI
jgi:hypothetical protein